MLKDMLSFLRTAYKPAPGEFLAIDAKVLVEKLAIRERGTLQGEAGQPPSASEAMDAVEQEIVSTIRAQATDDQGRTHDQLSTYAERIKSIDAAGAAADMKVLARQSEANLEAAILSVRGELGQAREEVIRRERALEAFRKRNWLDRPADPPKGHLVMWAILLGLFVIETLPNAAILGGGDDLGMVGGYAIAILFSLLSLACGYGAGRIGWTNAIHRRPVRKIAGVAFGLLMICCFLAVNLAIAHYRSAVGSGLATSQAAELVMRELKSDPFGISDVTSMIMMGVGILFAVIAMAEGWMWQDPYPGYAAVAKHLRDAEDDYNALVNDSLGRLEEIENRYVNEIKAARSALRDRRLAVPLLTAQRKRLVARFEGHIAHLQDVGRLLLTAYRDANRQARKDVAPRRFDQQWNLDGFGPIELKDSAWFVPDEEFKAADTALEVAIDRLQSAYQDAFRWIKELGTARDASEADARKVVQKMGLGTSETADGAAV